MKINPNSHVKISLQLHTKISKDDVRYDMMNNIIINNSALFAIAVNLGHNWPHKPSAD